MLTSTGEYPPHNLWDKPKGLTAPRGWEVREQPLGHKSISPRDCIHVWYPVPMETSDHGCTWPTYVQYIHKRALNICYCHCVQRLVRTLSGCWMSLSEMTRTIRGTRRLLSPFLRSCQRVVSTMAGSHIETSCLSFVYNRHCKLMRVLL